MPSLVTRQEAWSLVCPRATLTALTLMLAAGSRSLGAQGLPAWGPINPAAASRTGLRFEPYLDAAPHRWRLTLFSNLVPATLVLWSSARGPSGGFVWRLAVATLLAAYFYKTQETRFAAHRARGGAKGSLFLPAILLVVAAMVLGALLSVP